MADKIKNYKSEAKGICRTIATEFRKKPSNIALVFPSPAATDVKQSFETRNFNRNTFIIPVEGGAAGDTAEEKAKKRFKVDRQMEKLTYNVVPSLSCRAELIPLERYINIEEMGKMDYSFYDICGNVTTKNGQWFNRYQKYFANNMRLSVTMQVDCKRIGKNFEAVRRASKKYKEIVVDIIRKSGIVMQNHAGALSGSAWESLYSQLFILFHCMPDKKIIINDIIIYNNSSKVKRKNGKRGKEAEDMAFIDMILVDKKLAVSPSRFNKVISHYERQCKTPKIKKKQRKTKVVKKQMPSTTYEIARKLGIFGNYESIYDLPKGKYAWIKIYAEKAGLCECEVKMKIEKRLEKYGLDAK